MNSDIKDIVFNTVKDSEGIRQLLTIFMIATILTVFELFMFYRIIVPDINTQLDKQLQKASENLANNLVSGVEAKVTQVTSMIPPEIYDVILDFAKQSNLGGVSEDVLINENILLHVANTLADREAMLTESINRYTLISGIVFVAFLVLFLILLVYILNSRGEKVGKSTVTGAIVTVLILIVFQYNFYRLGKQYLYTGTLGNEEFIKLIIDSLHSTPQSSDIVAANEPGPNMITDSQPAPRLGLLMSAQKVADEVCNYGTQNVANINSNIDSAKSFVTDGTIRTKSFITDKTSSVTRFVTNNTRNAKELVTDVTKHVQNISNTVIPTVQSMPDELCDHNARNVDYINSQLDKNINRTKSYVQDKVCKQ